MLTLYYSPGACSLASLIALEESGLAFEAKRVDFSKAEQQSPEYLRLNPKGRVPVLIAEKGAISETPAILAYVAQIAKSARLAPLDDLFEFALMQSFNNYLCATVHVNHAHGRRGYRWTDDEAARETMKAKVPQTMGESLGLIETSMLRGPWVMGKDYSVADAYLFTMFGWAKGDGVDLDRLPKLGEHRARMLERPAVQRAREIERA
ncbi:glutathione S-transferase family protein [Neorhizobium sp. P12A]|jgi:glutathione S-transferase|uniref:glutathione S-transferase family protein n=1 Tax=Rhizobium/Agrobacterium group TaxID=227290 RepID=UPI0010436E07|nr:MULTISPECIES: glutathione S-transferase family protein [Rhizobium/Agrobacterium group]KAA0699815.1 glutathione S-transferase family protein [Neorhizobium sp. P12A]TCR93366.1 glutathione S-transferase [Rhizobium sp. BK376]